MSMYGKSSWFFVVITLIQSPSVGTAGLVAHWPLSEGEGDTFKDLVAGNDGFLPDDVEVEWVQDGPEGIQDVSVLFIGDEVPSYIETPFEGIGGTDPRTITAWVKALPQPHNSALVAWGTTENTRKWHFRINQGTNSLRTEFMGGQNFAETDIADDEWHFVASVFAEGGEIGEDVTHFLDGVFEEEKNGNVSIEIDTATGDEPGACSVHIGFACGHAGRFFVGQMSDVRIYDEELDEDALVAIMMGDTGSIPGDFDNDGLLTAADIDLLSIEVRNQTHDRNFDLNDDSLVNNDDRTVWVKDLRRTWFGDSDLDNEFNSSDFVKVFGTGEYEDGIAGNSTWATGDWNGDSEFDSSDFVTAFVDGGYERGPVVANAVPEPTGALLLMFSMLALIKRVR